jgi:hypothetical protein
MKAIRAINSPLEFEIPDPLFKMTIDTTQSGVTNTQSFELTLQDGPTDLTIDWGDGNSDVITTWNQAELLHGYASSGTYQLSLSGGFEGLRSSTSGPTVVDSDRNKIMSIDNWGIIQWKNMDYAFFACINMVGNYTDQPDTSLVTSMRNTFSACLSFDSPINFNTSNVTSLQSFISGFNGIYGVCSFNSPITFSDTSQVNTMQGFIAYQPLFNQPLDFDTSNVTTFRGCFAFNTAFNQPVTFNTSGADAFREMFYGCSAFNQPLAFNTATVTNMNNMFRDCTNFNQDISSFDISSLATAANMLLSSGFSTTNYDLLLPAWDAYGTSNVPFHAGTAQYAAGAPATARANMIDRGWAISDGGQV